MKTSELTGAALDWAVAKCEGVDYLVEPEYDGIGNRYEPTNYSTDWAQGGPIIEREKIELIPPRDEGDRDWMAVGFDLGCAELGIQDGPTPLIAAMRCYVASRLGDEVDIPKELQ